MNDMRPIDADEIRKKAVPHTRGYIGYSADIRKWAVLVSDIDDAPTIEAIPLPCKIGDEVFGIRNYKGKNMVQRGIVSEMFFVEGMSLVIVVRGICRGAWMEKVFPTYEAAEMAIRKEGEG